ncbi:MAG: response regulator [bacterium]|nr:response regulator [bacterium]
MRLSTLIGLVLINTVVILPGALNGQSKFNPTFQTFNETFPNRPVNDLLVDSSGYLWIGTYGAGLYRTDGIGYWAHRFDKDNNESLDSDFILCLKQDQKGRVWVGTERGLNLYNPQTKSFNRIALRIDGNDENNVTSIMQMHERKDGTMIFANYGVTSFSLDPVEQVGVLNDTIDLKSTPGSPQITGIVEDKYGRIYAVSNSGLLLYSESTEQFSQPAFFKDEPLLSVSMESIVIKDGKLWIGAKNQGLLEVLVNNSMVVHVNNYTITSKRLMDLKVWGSDHLICATENDGLISFNNYTKESEQFLHKDYVVGSVESNSIWKLLVDDQSRLWLGYYNMGIGLYDPKFSKFESIRHQFNESYSLTSNSVHSFHIREDGKVLVGMDGGGVDLYDPESSRFTSYTSDNGYSGLTNTSVQAVFQDDEQNLWVGTWGGGFFCLPSNQNSFININSANQSNISSDRIMKFAESEDMIYVATFGGGVHVIERSTKSITQLNPTAMQSTDLHRADIRDILVDQQKNLWIGSTIGLFKMDFINGDTTLRSFRAEYENVVQHPSFNYVLSLFEDSRGNIWIGTDGAGLYTYDPGIDSVFENSEFNKSGISSITAITEDKEKNIWITSKSGIAKISEEGIKYFTKDDGLTTNDFNYGAIAALSDGSILFGSVDGINVMKPSHIRKNSEKVRVYLTSLKIFNEEVNIGEAGSPLEEPISMTEEITLSSDQSVFSIEYTGINFTRPDQIQFAYYLEGLEEGWNYVDNQREANYTTLKQGDYTFKLKAANNDGVWSDDVLELKITVLPPWYKSNLALVAYVLLFLVLLYMLYLVLRVRINERQEVLNERERRHQGEELNQKKLQFFTNISHEFRTPLTLILSPLNTLVGNSGTPPGVERKLKIIQRNAKRLERLIDELMDFRKLNSGKLKIHVHHIDLYIFATEIINYFQVDADERNIKMKVEGDQQSHMAWVDSGLVEKMLFNLLSNAFKVTPDDGEINISLKIINTEFPLLDGNSSDSLRLSISDTGPGLSEDHVQKIFERFYQVEQMNKWYFGGTGIGLEVVRSFIELHKGKVEVESEQGKGTTFHLYFPIGKDHFQEEDIVKGEYPGKKEFLVANVEKVEFEDEELEELLTDTKKPSILVVDDNSELRNYMVSELKENYSVETAKNGKEGFEKAVEGQPDLIITDVIMPEMDGFQFCEKIKKELSTSHIPLIMLTAKSSTKDHIYGIDKGADGYITKPFEMPLVETQIRQLLKSRQVLFDKYLSGISEMENSVNTTSADRDFLQKVISYISENISDSKLSVELLASEVTLSRSQLYRKMKTLTGLNVNEFIRRIRLEQAKKMITTGNVNINEVCYQVGFSSASYFTKCYKEYFGVVPNKEKRI